LTVHFLRSIEKISYSPVNQSTNQPNPQLSGVSHENDLSEVADY
jgi:hypothetical protein